MARNRLHVSEITWSRNLHELGDKIGQPDYKAPQVGDKIKILFEANVHPTRIGSVGTITKEDRGLYTVDMGFFSWDLDESEFEVTTAEQLQLETDYEDRRRYQDEVDLYDTKGEYSHTEVKPQ